MNELTPKCISVVNYIINEINNFNEGKKLQEQVLMSTKRLQKILYFCDIEYMKQNNGIPLLSDEFYAWPGGPTIIKLYTEFYTSGKMHPLYNKDGIELTTYVKSIIHKILAETKDLDTVDLMDFSNIVNGPWYQVYCEYDEAHNQVISKKEMYNFYLNRQLFKNTKEEELNVEDIQEKEFTIKRFLFSITIEKNDQKFSVAQSDDDNMYFFTPIKEMNIELNFSSTNYSEYQTYIVFENLIKSILGRYILNGDNEKKYSSLPEDFIDLKNKVITWHCDDNSDSTLKLEYIDNGIIRISLSKSTDLKDYYNNYIKIKASSSKYGCYYKEFLEFFKHIFLLEQTLNKPVEVIQPQDKKEETKKIETKKLTLFKKINK